MTAHNQDHAQQVVERFKEMLAPQVRTSIADAEFTALAGLIHAAIAEELNATAELVEEVLKKIRASAEKPELGL